MIDTLQLKCVTYSLDVNIFEPVSWNNFMLMKKPSALERLETPGFERNLFTQLLWRQSYTCCLLQLVCCIVFFIMCTMCCTISFVIAICPSETLYLHLKKAELQSLSLCCGVGKEMLVHFMLTIFDSTGSWR